MRSCNPRLGSVRLRRRSVVSMSPLPQEAAKLLAVEPDMFVVERDRLVRKLRSKDRRDGAGAIA